MSAPPDETLHERIFRTAIVMFREHGPESVPVSRITGASGVAKGTFFNHFPTKNHLLAEHLHRIVDRSFEDIAGLGLAGTEAILAFAHALVRRFGVDRVLSEPLVLRLSALPAPMPPVAEGTPEPLRRDDERIHGWMSERLAEALPVAVPLAEPVPHELAFAAIWCLRGTLDEWARGVERPEQLHEATERRLSYLFESAGLPAGRGNSHPDTPEPGSR